MIQRLSSSGRGAASPIQTTEAAPPATPVEAAPLADGGAPSAVAFERAGTSAAAGSVDRVWLVVVGWTLALSALTFAVVRRHYSEYPPHYDSIGIYGGLFELVNTVQRDGVLAAIRTGFVSGTSWLQPAFVLLLAWAPVKAPEWLVSLNMVLLLAAQAAIVRHLRVFRVGRLRQVVAATLPLVPGAMYAWDGGIEDLRRDVQLVLLATAILFVSLAYVAAPSWRRGVALGVLVGLAQWSRDNAAAIVVIVTVPALVMAVLDSRRWSSVREDGAARRPGALSWLVGLGIVPVAVFLLVSLPYFWVTLPLTIERYQTSVWGVGEDRLESLQAFWHMPVEVLLGGDSRLSGRVRVAVVTGGLLVAAVALVGALWRAKVVSADLRRLREPASWPLFLGGAWVVLAVLLYNTLLLGYGARWHAVPFLPMAVGLVAMMVALSGTVRLTPAANRRLATVAVTAGCVVLLLSAPLRMILNQQPAPGAAEVQNLRAASVIIAQLAGGRPVMLLAYDTLSRHHARYYLAQAGLPPLTEVEPVAGAHGDPIDLDQPIRAGEDAQVLRSRLDRALRRWTAFALVYADTARYDDPGETLWPYLLGRPVVDGLLTDPDWKPVAHFTLLERELVLLENMSVRAGTGGDDARSAAQLDAAGPTVRGGR